MLAPPKHRFGFTPIRKCGSSMKKQCLLYYFRVPLDLVGIASKQCTRKPQSQNMSPKSERRCVHTFTLYFHMHVLRRCLAQHSSPDIFQTTYLCTYLIQLDYAMLSAACIYLGFSVYIAALCEAWSDVLRAGE